MSLPGGQILNVNTLDHWPMPRDVSMPSCYVSVGVGAACACRPIGPCAKDMVCHGDAFTKHKAPCARGLSWPDTEHKP